MDKRGLMIGAGATIGASLVLLLGTPAMGDGASGRPARPAQARTASANRAAALARTIVKAPRLASAVAATRQALAWGGIAIADGKHVRVRARAPEALMRDWSFEALNLAVEARDRETVGRLTLADLGRMMRDFGFPFRRGVSPGVQLVDLLKVWVSEARKQPGDSRSFTPLFLAAMAKYQKPSVDLAAGKYPPEGLRLTILETELISAAFLRVHVKGLRTTASVRPDLARWLAATPCSGLKDSLDQSVPLGGSVVGAQVDWTAGKGLEKAVEHMTGSELKAKQFSQIVDALNIVAKIQKLMAIYGAVTLRVFPQENDRVHKPLERQNVKSTLLQHFSAIAGLSEEDWRAYEQAAGNLGSAAKEVAAAAKDCLGFIGLPTLTDLGDLASELERWHIRWKLEASPNDARVDVPQSKFDFPGSFKHRLRRVSPYEGGAVLAIDVQSERAEDHPGELLERDVIARAELDTSIPPSLQTFVDAVVGGGLGLASSVVELAAGWLQSTVGPKAYGTLEVTFHHPACPGSSLRSLVVVRTACGISGTFSGHGDLDTEPVYGNTVTWNGNATFRPSGARTGPDGKEWQRYNLVSGSVTVQSSGGSPCTLTAGPKTLTFPAGAGEIDVQMNPPNGRQPLYFGEIASGNEDWNKSTDLTISCPGADPVTDPGWYHAGAYVLILPADAKSVGAGGVMAGSSTDNNVQYFTWNFQLS